MSDVVVIGAGAFGAWTAHHLSHAGARVTLVDAYGPGNSRSSSGDESRILRYGYGTDEIYSRLARQSREQWLELDARHDSGLSLWHPCGVLWLAPEGDTYAADRTGERQTGQLGRQRRRIDGDNVINLVRIQGHDRHDHR